MTATVIDAGDGLPLTVPALLHERVASRPDEPFVICDDDILTYGHADARSAVLAAGLLAAGIGKGSHVGILYPNGSDFVTAWLAAARIGAVSVPLSTFSTAAELATLLRGADVTILLSAIAYRSHDYVERLPDAVPELDLMVPVPLLAPSMPVLRRVCFIDEVPWPWSVAALVGEGVAIEREVLDAAAAAVTPADRMVIVHTSGSSAAPKGVLHTHGALIRHLDNLNQIRRYVPGEVLFSNSPYFWIGGFAYALLGTLVAGATLVCSNAATASGVLDTIERTRPTMVNGFAASVAHLPDDPSFAGRDLSSIRRGNLFPIMPPEVRPRDPELHHAMLGMTEAGSVCLVSEDESEQPEHRRGSFGRPAPGLEACVIDPDDGTACGPGIVGELLLRGPFMMEGYYGRARDEAFDADGWYHTGDLVSVDEDGFFYFKGRHGDMIKTAGANVSPREVEAAILDATGLVAHVVGLDAGARGQVVAAAIRMPEGAALDVDALKADLAARLSAYKVPRRFLLVAEADVPMMSSGKLDARALKDLFGGEMRMRRQAHPPSKHRAVSGRAERGPTNSAHGTRESSGSNSRLTIPALLSRNGREHSSMAVLVSDDASLTHAELDASSHELAARLVGAGVGKGDRVGLLAPNGIEWAVTAMAVVRIGAVLVPLSTLLRPPELLAQLGTVAATHLIAVPGHRGRDHIDELETAAPGLAARLATGGRHAELPFLRAIWPMDALTTGSAPEDLVVALENEVRPADDLAVLFTSGSRGTPKGVIHTHANALRATAAGLDARCVGAGERLYIPMPFFWMGGFGGGLLTVLVAGATLLTESDPEPSATLALLQRERVTLFRGWPDQAARLAAHPAFASADLSSLRLASLGAVLPPDQRPAPGARANLFGMTESFGPYCGARADTDLPAGASGSCGRPFDGVEVRIVDPESGAAVPSGAEGEVHLRGPNLMRGICGRPRSEVFTADGFYPTGDLGRLDDDGYLWFSGRVDDMFKVKGATVYPSEVEAALRALNEIAEAHVTNVMGDDGAEVAALVVSSASPEQLREAVRARLSSFKVPTVWLVVEDRDVVPMSATGKVDKARLQQLLADDGVPPRP